VGLARSFCTNLSLIAVREEGKGGATAYAPRGLTIRHGGNECAFCWTTCQHFRQHARSGRETSRASSMRRLAPACWGPLHLGLLAALDQVDLLEQLLERVWIRASRCCHNSAYSVGQAGPALLRTPRPDGCRTSNTVNPNETAKDQTVSGLPVRGSIMKGIVNDDGNIAAIPIPGFQAATAPHGAPRRNIAIRYGNSFAHIPKDILASRFTRW